MQIKTPIKNHVVELKDWITGRELEEINKPITDVKMKVEGAGKLTGEISMGEMQRKSTEKALEIIVVSIDGEKKDIVNVIYGMHSKDYKFVLGKVNDIITGEVFQKAE